MRSRYLGIARAAAAVSCVEEMEPRLLFSTAVKVKHAPVLHAVKPKKVVTVTHTTKATKAVAVKAKAKPKSTVKTISTATSSLTTHFVASGLNASDISPYDGPAAVSPFTPAQIRHFYGVDSVSFNGIAGNGTGQTIAIIDAYDEPNLVDSTNPNFATSDLHLFDAMYGLPDPPSFTKIDEYGGTNTPTAHVTAWSIEEALDVEWAHAMAPMANIVLVEAGSANDDDLFATSVDTAQSIPGVSVISMSFGEGEFYGESGDDSNFVSTATNPGITYLASTGDTGAGAPAIRHSHQT